MQQHQQTQSQPPQAQQQSQEVDPNVEPPYQPLRQHVTSTTGVPPGYVSDFHPRNVYVAALPANYTDGKLARLFQRFGKISSAKMMRHDTAGRGKGVGFVLFESDDSATSAIREMQGANVEGECIQVRPARISKPPNKQRKQPMQPQGHMVGQSQYAQYAYPQQQQPQQQQYQQVPMYQQYGVQQQFTYSPAMTPTGAQLGGPICPEPIMVPITPQHSQLMTPSGHSQHGGVMYVSLPPTPSGGGNDARPMAYPMTPSHGGQTMQLVQTQDSRGGNPQYVLVPTPSHRSQEEAHHNSSRAPTAPPTPVYASHPHLPDSSKQQHQVQVVHYPVTPSSQAVTPSHLPQQHQQPPSPQQQRFTQVLSGGPGQPQFYYTQQTPQS